MPNPEEFENYLSENQVPCDVKRYIEEIIGKRLVWNLGSDYMPGRLTSILISMGSNSAERRYIIRYYIKKEIDEEVAVIIKVYRIAKEGWPSLA